MRTRIHTPDYNQRKALMIALAHADMSQNELAKKAGMTASQISHFKSRRSSSTIRTVGAVSDAIGISLSEFIALGEG